MRKTSDQLLGTIVGIAWLAWFAGVASALAGMAIETAPGASPQERLAARELQRYLYVRTGRLPDELSLSGRIVIATHDSAVVTDSQLHRASHDLGPQEFLLQTTAAGSQKTWWIIGGDAQGALYGAYRFAERLGIRFDLHGEVIPDARLGALPDLHERGRPLFAIRGVNPWGSHPFGFDAWATDDYKAVFTQLVRMRMNFLGLHCYPEGHPYAEPTVWHGLPGDFDEQGRVRFSYPAHYYNTLVRGHWGPFLPKLTRDYHFGGALLFADDAWAPEVMRGLCPVPQTPGQCNALFNRAAAQFRDAFGLARELGVKTCLGTETPLLLPQALRERLQAAGKRPDDPAVIREIYEATFRRIMAAHPLDYYWLWTPEGWTWSGNRPAQYTHTLRDVMLAREALQRVGAPFKLATAGWVLGPQHDRAAFDADLPKDIPMSALSRKLGLIELDEAFGRIQGRDKWAIPWLESDSYNGLAAVQLTVGRMRRDAADALAYGCTGLLGLHWRTASITPNVSALAQAMWDQSPWNPAPGRLPNQALPAEEGALGGATARYPGRAIAGTTNDTIYQTCRYNFAGYDLEVPNGRYRVTLQFCEPYFNASGRRLGDFTLQGRTVIENLDIHARVGQFAALDIPIEAVAVTNGWLQLRVVARRSWPCLSGVVIEGKGYTRKINCGGPAYADYEADLPNAPSKKRSLPCADFYADWARAQFGAEAAADIAKVFTAIDGYVPASVASRCPSGALTPIREPWDQIAPRFAFVDELADLRPRVRGAGNRDRFDYWLNLFRYHRLLAQVRCALGRFDAAMQRAEKAGPDKPAAARSEALFAWRDLLRLYGETYRTLLRVVRSPGELAMVVNLENHAQFWPAAIAKPLQRLRALGVNVPSDALPSREFTGEPRLIVPTVRTLLRQGERLRLRVIVLDNQLPRQARLHWRQLGRGPFHQIPFQHLARAAHEVTLPGQEQSIEYYLEAQTPTGQTLHWPPTAPRLNQTVTVW